MTLTVLLLQAFGFFGVGALALSATPRRGVALPLAVGMAVSIAIGGWLQLVHLANAQVALVLFIVNLTCALGVVLREKTQIRERLQSVSGLQWVGVLVLLLLASLFVEAEALNAFDDFRKYLPRPVRMAMVGTLAGDPYSGVGYDSLGGLSWLQVPMVAIGGMRAIGALDHAVCFMACGLVLVEWGGEGRSRIWAAALGAFLLFDAQLVNTSSVYSSVLLTWASLRLWDQSCDQCTGDAASAPSWAWRPVVLAGVLIGSVATLKATAAIALLAMLLAGSAMQLLIAGPHRGRSLVRLGAMAGAALAALLPWLWSYWPEQYAVMLTPALSSAESAQAVADWSCLVSPAPLQFGGRGLFYPAFVAVSGVVVWRLRPGHRRARLATLVITILVLYGLAPLPFKCSVAIRYLAPPALGLFLLCAERRLQEGPQQGSRVLAVAWAFTVVLGMDQGIVRYWDAARQGSFIAYEATAGFTDAMLTEKRRARIHQAFEPIPKRARVLTWTLSPIYYPFDRVQVVSVDDILGLSAPWVRGLPDVDDAGSLERFFAANRIDFVMHEHGSMGMKQTRKVYRGLEDSKEWGARQTGKLGVQFGEVMDVLPVGLRVYDDGVIAVWDVRPLWNSNWGAPSRPASNQAQAPPPRTQN